MTIQPIHPEIRRTDFLAGKNGKLFLACNVALAIIYFIVLAFFFKIGNPFLFTILIIGEVYHLWQVLTFIYTVWDTSYEAPVYNDYHPGVDIFITVVGEPVEIVEQTVRAAKAMQYQGEFTVNILNDGLGAKKENWKDMEDLAAREGVRCITREKNTGFKAGNINNGVAETSNPLVVVFDCDHVPHVDFLTKTVPYFGDAKVAFVQTPQFYKNHNDNLITSGSWEQQELFFGPICKGRNRHNAAQMCGTNMVVRRSALLEVGGMYTKSIAEDFLTGLMMHELGYKSVYVAEVLAEGLATEDLLNYSKQQFRWARGALDVLFRHNPIFSRNLTWPQKIEYISAASFYLSGSVIVLDAVLPLFFFYTGLVPLQISGMLLATAFLPYIFVTLYTVQSSANFTYTFRSLAFSMGAFPIHIKALWVAITGQDSVFSVTVKGKIQGNFLSLVRVHIGYIVLVVVGVVIAFVRSGLTASLVNNIAWSAINISVFIPFILAALPQKSNPTIEVVSRDAIKSSLLPRNTTRSSRTAARAKVTI